MQIRKSLLLLAAGAAMATVASPTYAATITTPLTTFPSGAITSTPVNLAFAGFSSAFKTANGISPNAILTNVFLTVVGTTGGSVTATNYAPSASAFSGTGTFGLTANTTSNTSVTASGTDAIPCGGGVTCGAGSGGSPAGVATATITPTAKTFFWSIFGGTFDFTQVALALPVTSSYVPTFTVGGPFVSTQAPSFTVSPTLTNTFLTYDYNNSVPGPLPLAGGLTAFAFSRRLRRRISSAAN